MTAAALDVPVTDDSKFFRALITVMAIVLVAGFVVQLAAGRSSFNAPLIVHVHAIFFMGWVAIVLSQAWLATSGNIALHRRLGRVAAVWALGMVVLGTAVTVHAIQSGRTPFFFQPQHFVIANPLSVLAFAGLLFAAIRMRKQTDWHARLQIGALLLLMGPSFGRIIPMPLLMPYAFETAGLVALVFPAYGALRDWRVHGKPHPAWIWQVAVLIGVIVLARVLAFSPAGEAVYAAVTANTPLAGTDGLAFPPPPPMPM
jgi:hypothetical protein